MAVIMVAPTLAQGADLPLSEPASLTSPISASSNWTGFYIGAQAGWASADAEGTFDNGFAPLSFDPEGALAGGHVGYNQQFGRLVLGLEADADWTDLEAQDSAPGSVGREKPVREASIGSAEINWQASLRARLGAAFGRVLLYVTGGIAAADADIEAGKDPGGTFGYSDTKLGWTAGGGFEAALSERITTRLEYRYSEFQEFDGIIFGGGRETVDLSTHSLRGGISMKFGRGLIGPAGVNAALISSTPVRDDWSGFYTGAFAGWGSTDVEATELYTSAAGGLFYMGPGEDYAFDAEGLVAGIQAGYDWQHSRFVLGASVEVGEMDLDGKVVDPNSVPSPFIEGRPVTSFDSDLLIALTGRVGLTWDRLLLFAKGGVAFLDAEAGTVDLCGRGPCGQTKIDAHGGDILVGITAGAGAELALSEHWRLGAEYRWFSFDGLDVKGEATNLETYSQQIETEDVHTARAFVNYRW